jgi:hypothetical protein
MSCHVTARPARASIRIYPLSSSFRSWSGHAPATRWKRLRAPIGPGVASGGKPVRPRIGAQTIVPGPPPHSDVVGPRGIIPACSDGCVSSGRYLVVEDHNVPFASGLESADGTEYQNGQAAVAVSAELAIDSTRRSGEPRGRVGFRCYRRWLQYAASPAPRHEVASSRVGPLRNLLLHGC